MKELKRLLPYIKKYRNRIIFGLIFVTLSNICSTILPRFVGGIVDTITSQHYTMDTIYRTIGIIFALTAGSGLFMFLTRQTIIVVSRHIEYDLRHDFIRSVEKQSSNFFNHNSTGSLMAYATNDIPATREFLGPAIMYAANTVTTFSFALYFMLSLNAKLTLISLLPLPIIAFSTYRIGKKVFISFKNVQDQFSKLTTHAQESFSGVRVIRSYVREDYETKTFSKLSDEYVKHNLRLSRYQSAMMPFLMVLVGFSQLLVLGYGGYLVLHKQATLGDLTQFFIYINLLIWPVAAIGWVTNLIQRAAASTARLGKIMDTVTEIENDEKTNHSIKSVDGDIVFDNVSMQYSEQSPEVLSEINLKIPAGTSLGITGGVGCGKTTLVNLLPRLYEVTSGNLSLNGYNIKEIPIEILRESISVVSQEPFLFSTTIRENIKFGRIDATEEQIIEVSKAAFLHDEILKFPNGYDTLLGERGITLSGGQKQRLAIARALIKESPILILDDSLSSVDAQTEDKILKSIKEYLKDRISIVISHRLSTLKELDNIIFIDSGRIIEQGNHNELMKINGRYFEIYSYQQLETELESL